MPVTTVKASKIDKQTYYRGVRMIPYDLLKEVTIAMIGVLGVRAHSLCRAVVAGRSVGDAAELVEGGARGLPDHRVRRAGGNDRCRDVRPAVQHRERRRADAGGPRLRSSGRACTSRSTPRTTSCSIRSRRRPRVTRRLHRRSEHVQGGVERSAAEVARRITRPGLATATVAADGTVTVPAGDYGPVSVMMDRMLTLARSGGLDALLLTSDHFYQTDFTRATALPR